MSDNYIEEEGRADAARNLLEQIPASRFWQAASLCTTRSSLFEKSQQRELENGRRFRRAEKIDRQDDGCWTHLCTVTSQSQVHGTVGRIDGHCPIIKSMRGDEFSVLADMFETFQGASGRVECTVQNLKQVLDDLDRLGMKCLIDKH